MVKAGKVASTEYDLLWSALGSLVVVNVKRAVIHRTGDPPTSHGVTDRHAGLKMLEKFMEIFINERTFGKDVYGIWRRL